MTEGRATHGPKGTPPLLLPAEPTALKRETRTLLEQAPEAGMELVAAGEWIAAPLWDHWQALLEPRGMDRARFLDIVIGYQNELRLWVMGERPWDHCVAGLAGRVIRRMPVPAGKNGRAVPSGRGRRPTVAARPRAGSKVEGGS